MLFVVLYGSRREQGNVLLRSTLFFAFLVLPCLHLIISPQSVFAADAAEVVPGEYVVSFVGETARARNLARGEALFGDLATTKESRERNGKLRTLLSSNIPLRRAQSGAVDTSYDPQEAEEFCNALRAEAGASREELICEPNFVYRVDALPSDYTGQASDLYGLAKIQAPEAWDTTTGGDVIVAVLDTGIDYTHPDLASNMWVNEGEIPGNGIDDDHNGYTDDVYGVDFANGDGDPFDDHGHGTHVAGTIGAVGNNDLGVVGVNWKVKLVALKFLTASGSGTTFFLPDAIEYAVDNGVRVINASFGGRGDSQFLRNAIDYANKRGVLFVAAAGNFGTDNDSLPHYPSNYEFPNVISVAATDVDDHLGWFSNFGKSSVHLAAPGVQILSTLPGGRYGKLSGTSMAAPHVTGAAALVLSQYPEYTGQQVKDSLVNSVSGVSSLRTKTLSGGRLNVLQALGADPQPSLPEESLSITQFGSLRKNNRPLAINSDAYATVDGTPGMSFSSSLVFEGVVDGACELPAYTLPDSGRARLRFRRLLNRSSVFRFSDRIRLIVGSTDISRKVRSLRSVREKSKTRVKQRKLRTLVKSGSELLQQRMEQSCDFLARQVSWKDLR
ncbi:MAG: S8 family serine peptidase [Bdellovibrionales bacterium]|nr:S8 family serine peptidase [Bdellovibrionales bacterium]